MIDNAVKKLGRDLREVPVGFKWFVPGSSKVLTVSVARRALGRVSFDSTERCGPPIKTGRSWIFLQRRLQLAPPRIQASTTANYGGVRQCLLHPHRRTGLP